jgi:hypothetical protein
MAARLHLNLSNSQQADLEWTLKHATKPYLRERAAALLKIASGQSPHWVALHGLLQPRDPDTVYLWLKRYLDEGLAGLKLKAGRGRKPAFSPSLPDRG